MTANLRIGLNDIQVAELAVDEMIENLTAHDRVLQWLIEYINDNITDDKTFQREVSPLLSIQDAYPKMLIARIRHDAYQYEGIRIVDFSDWLTSI